MDELGEGGSEPQGSEREPAHWGGVIQNANEQYKPNCGAQALIKISNTT